MPKKIPPQPSVISIQGYKGSYHHIAAQSYFGKNTKVLERSTFPEVFADLEKSRADYALVATENTLIGSIIEPLDLLIKHNFSIQADLALHIHHHLHAIPGAKLSDINTVYSQQEALNQCRDFLYKHKEISTLPAEDTAKSVKQMMERKEKSQASIASRLAGQIYGAEIIAESIETNPHNYTRFFVLSPSNKRTHRVPSPNKKPNQKLKTSFVIWIKHQPGTLAACLNILAEQKLNLTRIESRPLVGKPWEYLIYVEIEHLRVENLEKKVWSRLKSLTSKLKVLGTYLKGEVYET